MGFKSEGGGREREGEVSSHQKCVWGGGGEGEGEEERGVRIKGFV